MLKQAEFPGSSFALALLPDETLFSWCSRYHRLTANGLSRTTCLQLFGHHQVGSAHDFPARIDVLISKSNGALGNAAEIIQQQTILPYYLPFKSKQLAMQSIVAMRSNGIGSLKFRMGLLTSGLGAAHPLKSCAFCISDDMVRYGWAYWHRNHQLPGVWFCPVHRAPLLVSPLKLDHRARFSWVLPLSGMCERVAELEQVDVLSKQGRWLINLAEQCCVLPSFLPGQFDDPTTIARAFRHQMRELGMTNDNGKVLWSMVRPTLEQLANNVSCLPELKLLATPSAQQELLARILSGRKLMHPLKYLPWIVTWFGGLQAFSKLYDRQPLIDIHISQVAAKDVSAQTVDWERESLLKIFTSVETGEISVTAAAQLAGVSYSTMAAWLCREFIVAPRRPKYFDAVSWGRAVHELRRGHDKIAVAEACQVSITTITRVLRSVPGLQEQWHRVRFEKSQRAAKESWGRLLGLYAAIGIKGLRKLEPAAYAWLYRNDRAWLNDSIRTVPRVLAQNYAVTRIQKTDARMADVLRQFALASNEKGARWTIEDLKRSLPALAKVLSNPEKWPLTVNALASVLKIL